MGLLDQVLQCRIVILGEKSLVHKESLQSIAHTELILGDLCQSRAVATAGDARWVDLFSLILIIRFMGLFRLVGLEDIARQLGESGREVGSIGVI